MQMWKQRIVPTDRLAGPCPTSREPAVNQNDTCILLHWMGCGQVVAKGRVVGKHPKIVVEEKPLGPRAWKVWVEQVIVVDVELYRGDGTLDSVYLSGNAIAWPYEFIQPDHQ